MNESYFKTKSLLRWCFTSLFLMLGAIGFSQITVGTGNTTGSVGPWSSCWGFSYHQMIYLQSDINASGTINSITFTSAGALPTTATGGTPNTPQGSNNSFRVYIGHTSKSDFTSTTDWIAESSMTLVYEGPLTMPTVSGQPLVINLSTAFEYNNTSNLVIAIDENSPGYSCTYNWLTTSIPAQTNRNLYFRSDTVNPNPASPPTSGIGLGRANTTPRVILGGLTVSTPPLCITNPTAPANNASNILNSTFSWPATSGSPTGYLFSLGTNPEGDNIISNQDLGLVTSHNIGSGILLPSTQYFWSVTPYNGNGNSLGCSIWSFTSATAPNCATNLLPANNATNVAINPTLSWTAPTNPSATSYDVFMGLSESNLTFVGNVTTTTVNVSPPLAANTVVFWRVVPKNVMGDATDCAVNSFTTGSSLAYCPSTGTSSSTQITNVTISGITTLNNTTTGNAGYADFTGLTPTVSAFAGDNVTFSITATSDPGRSIFVDWNNDGVFDVPGERVFTTAAYVVGASVGSFTVPPGTPPGNYRIRVVVNFLAPTPTPCNTNINGETEDYTLVVAVNSPCAGTPTPGNTLSTATDVCLGEDFTLSVENLTEGTGVTYQWQTSPNGSDWTNAGPNAATWTTNQSTATHYRCIVTCDGEDGISAPILVNQNAPNACYCEPTYSIGKTDGDLISNISITGTTLANNSGTAPVNPAYTFFTGAPNLTAELRQGTTYTVNVTVGTWGNQHVRAWIDFNEDGIFSEDEVIGAAVIAPGQGGSGPFPPATFNITLTENSPLGTKRMRVRSVYSFENNFFQTIDPCVEYGYGETEDYEVTIIEPITTQVTPSFCNTTIESAFYDEITAEPVVGATAYRFRITDGVNTFTTSDLSTNSFVFNDFGANIAYGTTYDVSVSVEVDQAWSPFGPTCPITLTADPLTSLQFLCNGVMPQAGTRIYTLFVPLATTYRFSVTNLSTNEEVFVENNQRFFFMHTLSNFAFNTYNRKLKMFHLKN